MQSRDFYNIHNESFKLLDIKYLQFIDQSEFKDNILQGIYKDQLFTYYKFTVTSKNNREDIFNKINNLLLNNECKLQLYYTDISLDLTDYNNPINNYLNSLFLELNPTLIQKKNIFFMNYHLLNSSKFFHFLEKSGSSKIILGFSRIEVYS